MPDFLTELAQAFTGGLRGATQGLQYRRDVEQQNLGNQQAGLQLLMQMQQNQSALATDRLQRTSLQQGIDAFETPTEQFQRGLTENETIYGIEAQRAAAVARQREQALGQMVSAASGPRPGSAELRWDAPGGFAPPGAAPTVNYRDALLGQIRQEGGSVEFDPFGNELLSPNIPTPREQRMMGYEETAARQGAEMGQQQIDSAKQAAEVAGWQLKRIRDGFVYEMNMLRDEASRSGLALQTEGIDSLLKRLEYEMARALQEPTLEAQLVAMQAAKAEATTQLEHYQRVFQYMTDNPGYIEGISGVTPREAMMHQMDVDLRSTPSISLSGYTPGAERLQWGELDLASRTEDRLSRTLDLQYDKEARLAEQASPVSATRAQSDNWAAARKVIAEYVNALEDAEPKSNEWLAQMLSLYEHDLGPYAPVLQQYLREVMGMSVSSGPAATPPSGSGGSAPFGQPSSSPTRPPSPTGTVARQAP